MQDEGKLPGLVPVCPTRYFPEGNLGPKQKEWWGWPSYTQSLSSNFPILLTHSSSEEEWVRSRWGGMRKARFMIHMKDPPGNVKHNKWRSIIPVRQTAFPASLFLLPKHRGFFFFVCMSSFFLLVCLKTSLFFLLLLNDYLAWWLFQKLHKPPSVDTWYRQGKVLSSGGGRVVLPSSHRYWSIFSLRIGFLHNAIFEKDPVNRQILGNVIVD